jgi:alpha-ribazole phosphatase
MLIHLIRHTAVAAPGICYGHYDVPLADTFAAEAAALKAKLLPNLSAGFQVFSSPAARCLALAAEFTTDVTADERLREMNFGTWENRQWAELPPAETEPWMTDYVTLAPPQGETFRAVQERATAFLTELTTTAPEAPVPRLVFSHGGTIRALVSACLELPLRNAFRLRVDYASVTTLKYQYGSWNLLGLNR